MSTSIQDLLTNFERTGISVEHFISTLLTTSDYQFHPLAQSLKNNIKNILDVFQTTESTSEAVSSWALTTANNVYQSQMETLTDKESGFHFLAKSTTEEKLTTFTMEDVASRMRHIAPDLWSLFNDLLCADLRLKHRKLLRDKKERQSVHPTSSRTGTGSQPVPDHGDIEMEDVALNDWANDQDFDTDLVEDEEDEPHNKCYLIFPFFKCHKQGNPKRQGFSGPC
jgi:hypothetical protein